MNSLYNAIFGQAGLTNNLTSPATQQAVNQAFSGAYQQYAQNQLAGQYSQQQAQQLYNSALSQQLGRYRQEWMIAGKAMDFTEFVDTLCPDPEDPMRTLLILKYSGMNK
jgi:hypothetical protein